MDPIISSIAGTAAKATGSVADNKIRHALLLPAATVIGKEIAARTERMFARGNARRLEFLNRHVDRAAEIGGAESIEDISNDPGFIDWASEVSKVDPEDAALSDIWQAALVALQHDGAKRLRIMSIAKQMQPDEAASFLGFARGKRRSSASVLPYQQRFTELGLFKSPSQRILQSNNGRMLIMLSALLLTGGIGALFGTPLLLESFLPRQWRAEYSDLIGPMSIAIPFGLTLVAVAGFYRFSQPILTEDGEHLLTLVDRLLMKTRPSETPERPDSLEKQEKPEVSRKRGSKPKSKPE